METHEDKSGQAFRKFIRRNTKMALAITIVLTVAAIVAVYVFFKVVADAQVLGIVPTTLGLWSVGTFFAFCITLIIWELIFVAIWLIPVVIVIFILWYRKLPEEERKEYGMSPKRGTDPRRTEGSGFFSFLVTVVWLIIVWITGRWTLTFNAWTFNDFVYTWFIAFLWILVPCLIGGAIFLIWWLRKEPIEES
jgi:hypothetical protein